MGIINRPTFDVVSFTRASSATRINALGVLESVAANVPRIDYDPVTLAVRGLLVEEQRTNVLINSGFSGGGPSTVPASWSLTGVSSDVIADVFNASVLGFSTRVVSIRRAAGAVGSYQGLQSNGHNYSSGTTLALSCYVRIPTGVVATDLYLYGANSGSGQLIASAATLNAQPKDQWVKYSIVYTLTQTQTFASFLSLNGPVGAGFDIACPQLEIGSFPTSYVPTAGAQATRAADIALIDTLSPWWNPSGGSFYAEVRRGFVESSAGIIASHTPTSKEFLFGYGSHVRINSDVSVVSNALSPNIPGGSVQKSASRFNGAESAVTAAGRSVLTGGGMSQALQATSLRLGMNGAASAMLNGHICKIRYYPKLLSNAELQALTA